LIQYEFLIGSDGFDHITNRHHAHQMILFDDGKMAEAFVGHKRHALVDGLIWMDGTTNTWCVMISDTVVDLLDFPASTTLRA